MLGTVVNTIAIIFGSLIGAFLKKGIPDNVKETLMNGLALCVLFIGIKGALQVDNELVLIISIVLGAIIGELIDINNGLQRFGDSIEKRFKGKGGKISEGFVTASLIYCVGAMAIVGSLDSGLKGDHKTLFLKSMLDGVSSIIFSSTLGIGVILSAIPVFLYQGTITLSASLLSGVLVGNVRADMSAVGSLLIIGLGLNMLNLTKIKVANLLPAILIPILYQCLIMVLKL